MRKIRNLVVLLLLLLVTGIGGYKLGKKTVVENDGGLDLSMLWRVKRELGSKYLDKSKIDASKINYGVVKGMVETLDDPYTVFLTPQENKSQNEDLAGQFGGVGIQLGYKDKTLAVMSPLPKTPADRAGVLAGDLILKINEKETTGISLNEAVELIRGPIGTEVTLKMYREGKKDTFDVKLKREAIVVPSMELEWKEKDGKKVAWLKLYKFSEQLYTDWPNLVDKVNQEKGSNFGGIVLDLRNNPGGFLEASVLVGSDFIKDGVLVTQASSDGKNVAYKVDKTRNKLLNDKMVVLVNGGSASAAEILAGALKGYDRAKLIGEKTFGKGTVQSPENFSDGSGIHITIAKWLLPDGKNIHKVGVDPDVEVKYVPNEKDPKADNQLEKAIEVLLK